MYARLLKSPKKESVLLLGPRGTGKSSWLREHFPEAISIDLLDSTLYTELLASPHRLINHIGDSKTVLIDEVQRIPELLNEVHRLIESERRQFVITGSSARKLKKQGVNLLAGRALAESMFPLTASELGKDFDLKFSLKYGTLPRAYASRNPAKYLKTYVQTYLREEVLQEGLTRNLSAFARFLEAASFSQAQVLNLSSVAEDCAIPRKTVENYFQILEDLLIGVRLSCFTRRAKRKVIAHPKFFYFDAGVFQALRPKGPLDSADELGGIALETLVMQEIRALNSYLELGYSLHYWRTESQVEVDFVLYGERGLKAIEVKKSNRLRAHDFDGLESFLSDYPMAQATLFYGGTRTYREGAIQVVPVYNFFENARLFL